MATAHGPSLGSLLRDRRFAPLFWTQALGAFNDNIFKNALVMLITYRSATLMGLTHEKLVAFCGAIFILPYFLFSATAGTLADQRSKSSLSRATKIWEILAMIMGAAAFAMDSLPLLLFTLFMLGMQSSFFGPIKYGILPELLEERELLAGNALVEMGTFISILLGTILGGILIGLKSGGPVWVVGISLSVSIIGWLASRRIPEMKPQSPHLKVSLNPIRPTYELFVIAAKTKSVLLSILAISWFWLLGAIVLSVLPPLCKDLMGAPDTVLTFILAIFSVGVGAGSILCEKLSSRTLELGLVPVGSIGMSLFALDIGWMDIPQAPTIAALFAEPAGWRFAADLFFFSVSAGLFTVPLYTLMQLRSDPKERSRIIAANNVLNALFMILGAVGLIGLYSLGLSAQQMFLVLAGLNALVAAYVYTVLPEFLFRFVCWVLSHTAYRLRLRGEENFPATGAAVLVCNHVSFVDWILISAACPRPIRFVMDHSFMKIPLAGRFFKRGKVIPIASQKDHPGIYAAAFESVSAELRAGELVCIFPEGEITRTGEMTFFRKGIERILARDQVPVVPVALGGMWGSFFSRRHGRAMTKPFRRVWSRVDLQVAPPIPPEKASAAHLQSVVAGMLGVANPPIPEKSSTSSVRA